MLLFGYLLVTAHLVFHELGHAAAARLMGIRVFTVRAGGGEPFLKIGAFELAPWPTGGYTEIDAAGLARRSTAGKVLFFEAGSMADLVLWGVTALFAAGVYARINQAVFFMLLFGNHCPLLPGSDIRKLVGSLLGGGTGQEDRGGRPYDRRGDQEAYPGQDQSTEGSD